MWRGFEMTTIMELDTLKDKFGDKPWVLREEVESSLDESRLKNCYHQANPCTREMKADNRPCIICGFVFEILEGEK
jgi:hypothetical protein